MGESVETKPKLSELIENEDTIPEGIAVIRDADTEELIGIIKNTNKPSSEQKFVAAANIDDEWP